MKNNQFLRKNIVFTGASVIKRDYLFGLAEAIGANPQKGINKQTDLLIVGEKHQGYANILDTKAEVLWKMGNIK